MSEFEEDIDQRLAAMDEKEMQLNQDCHYVSCCRVATEIRRLAKAEKRLIPYLHATFTLMNTAHSMLDPELGRDASIELIGLLESEDRARSIQPDLDEAEYEGNVNWLSSCGYDNLAKATGSLNGYNSEGMHECIADGINVCRRTGKLQCIVCFREYATDVYQAADDLELAMHYCRAGIAHENPGPHDRRWAGARDMVQIQMRNGDFQGAAESVVKAAELCETWHSPLSATLTTKLLMTEIGWLLGEPEKWEPLLPVTAPPAGEFPHHEMRVDQIQSLAAVCQKDYTTAIELLGNWDRKLTQKRCLDDWFDNRLRLLLAHRLAGNDEVVERLGNQLQQKADDARDWLTLRCLEHVRDTSADHSPLPTVAEATVAGPGT